MSAGYPRPQLPVNAVDEVPLADTDVCCALYKSADNVTNDTPIMGATPTSVMVNAKVRGLLHSAVKLDVMVGVKTSKDDEFGADVSILKTIVNTWPTANEVPKLDGFEAVYETICGADTNVVTVVLMENADQPTLLRAAHCNVKLVALGNKPDVIAGVTE